MKKYFHIFICHMSTIYMSTIYGVVAEATSMLNGLRANTSISLCIIIIGI